MLALGAGLRAAGLEVRCATHGDFADAVREAGLDLRVVQGDAKKFFGGAAGVAVRDRLRDARAFRRFFDGYLLAFYDKLLREVTEACADADVVIAWPWTRFATSLAEALRVPVFIACPYPPMHLPTSAFANPFQETADTGSARDVARSWRLALPALQMGDASLNRWRRDALGLPAIGWREDLRRLRRLPHLLGFSEAVLPRPRDWAPSIVVTGFWFLEAASTYEPPPELRDFLAGGPPPVAIGFSSQATGDSAALAQAIVDGVSMSGARAVVLQGFGALAGIAPSDRLCPVRSVPYDWLFPRCAVAVHHGGSGSTAEALRSGVPSVVVPFGYDQPLWGDRLFRLGAGVAPIAAHDLTAGRLADAIRTATADETLHTRAGELARQIRSEDGVKAAVDQVLAAVRR